jgi:hypothetical protein
MPFISLRTYMEGWAYIWRWRHHWRGQWQQHWQEWWHHHGARPCNTRWARAAATRNVWIRLVGWTAVAAIHAGDSHHGVCPLHHDPEPGHLRLLQVRFGPKPCLNGSSINAWITSLCSFVQLTSSPFDFPYCKRVQGPYVTTDVYNHYNCPLCLFMLLYWSLNRFWCPRASDETFAIASILCCMLPHIALPFWFVMSEVIFVSVLHQY